MAGTIPIAIINWNGIEDTMSCVEHVLAQTYTDFRIILVDNGSENKEGESLRNKFAEDSRITVILNESNTGFTRASNQIFRDFIINSQHEYVALLNNDAFPNPDWLENLVRAAKETGASMVSSKLVNFNDRRFIDNTGHFMLNTGEVIPDGFGAPVDSYIMRKENIGACAGAALYRVDMLRQIGVFDEYFHTGYEDAELGIRAVITGHKSVYEPSAQAFHKMSISVNKIRTEDYMVKIQASIFYTYFKLMPTTVIVLNVPFIVFRTGVLFFLFILFRRPGYLRIYYRALKNIVGAEREHLLSSRRDFHSRCEVKSSWYVMSKQRFFLVDNIRRFFLYFIKGERTIFEKTNDR